MTTSSSTKPAQNLANGDPRLEPIGWTELLPLLDEHFGADWGRTIDWHVTRSMQRTGFADGPATVIVGRPVSN